MSACSPARRPRGPRLHPEPRTRRPHPALLLLFLLAPGACGIGEGAPSQEEGSTTSDTLDAAPTRDQDSPVLPGLDVLLLDFLHLVEGRRMGL
ncbi:MAG: hypothetical protein EA352_01200, partial [Gemmatimonadales bacterium]